MNWRWRRGKGGGLENSGVSTPSASFLRLRNHSLVSFLAHSSVLSDPVIVVLGMRCACFVDTDEQMGRNIGSPQ